MITCFGVGDAISRLPPNGADRLFFKILGGNAMMRMAGWIFAARIRTRRLRIEDISLPRCQYSICGYRKLILYGLTSPDG